MSAIVPGYEYDIFISYRQHDNKRDGWVTNFVSALKDELEVTIKNPVSIYFDENPHDGLLETHQVDASLAKKLKCLVFIPIVSQTYCDPKCFAWEHEFMPFKEMATTDEIGMNITLANGNVASRILPIQIHDLDQEDLNNIESELAGHLRSIEFIYKEPGVNRPLKPEDLKEDNLNKTNYHNQINKVANALKEIGNSLIRIENSTAKDLPSQPATNLPDENNQDKKSNKLPKLVLGSIMIFTLLALAYFFYPKENTDQASIDDLEKSIAVLAFKNMSNDPEQDYFGEGISEEIINALVSVEGLKVAGRTSSFSFKNKDTDLREIADKLGVAMILEGSVRKAGDRLRITAQLINAENGFHLWSQNFEGNLDDIFKVQDEIAQGVIEKLKITLQGKTRSIGAVEYQPKREAYDLYLKGLYQWNKRGNNLFNALEYFTQAAETDSLYSLAHAGMAQTYVLMGYYELGTPEEVYPLAHQAAEKAINLDINCAEAYAALGFYNMYYKWNWMEGERMFEKAIEVNFNYAPAHYWYNNYLRNTQQFDRALKEAEIALELEPLDALSYIVLASTYQLTKDYQRGLEMSRRALELNPFLLSYQQVGKALMNLERYPEARQILMDGIEQLGRPEWLLIDLCEVLMKENNIEEALKIYEELNERSDTEHISKAGLAQVSWHVKKEDEAIEIYRLAVEERSIRLFLLGEYWASKDPRLAFIDEALNLPE